MNKYLYSIIRVLQWFSIAIYLLYILFVGYQLTLKRLAIPASPIPVLSTSLVQSDGNALESRFVLPPSSQYTASTSGVFGKSEPFNP